MQEFTLQILKWFNINGRELPWRETHDPYAIWVSEIILQQTRISQGTDYWFRFMRRFPCVEELARASEDEVLRLWQGLGYYSRARNMHAAARQIMEMGHFPNTLEELKLLRGVGDYTAAAIASFAFAIPVAAVDGNVYRVLSRYHGIDIPINTTDGKGVFTTLANELLPHKQPAEFNQAMMDFGATQCTPLAPKCETCVLAESCVARREGLVNKLPAKIKKLKVRERKLRYIYIRCNHEIALHRRGKGDIWQGLWEPLLLEEGKLPQLGVPFSLRKGHVRHVLTHQVLYADIYLAETEHKPTLPEDYIWIKERDLDKYALPRLVEILIEACQ